MRTINAITADLKTATKNQAFHRGINDGGEGFNPQDQIVRKLRGELADAQAAAEQAAKDAAWTLEITESRRAAWNTEVKALSAKKKGGKLGLADMLPIQKKLGFTMGDLKDAITRHGL